ncbi:MAG: RNB domain-containing ribonuclease [Planctomycetota bacterium]|nr:RNB domain-containing ribonuclease [Planctomycetota bacterium]
MTRTYRPHRSDLREIARRAMVQRGLLPDFSPAAIAQAREFPGAAADSGPGIRDLRGRLWCSIDNDDSRDLDQLSVAEPLANGAVKILVAIADVDALVARGTPIDQHARTNTTSVYTAAEIFPMLPERLSTDLTSLNQDCERLAVVAEMTVAKDGIVNGSDMYRATVLNRAQLAYDGVAAWLDGHAEPPPRLAAVPGLDEQLRIQDRVAQALRAVRYRRGALLLDTLEPRAVYEGDVLTDMRPDERNRAKELIEDFMIAANSATVAFLAGRKFPSLRRILRSPERWARIVQLAADLGGRLPVEPSAEALEAFLDVQRRANPTRFPDISLSVVKLLGSGEYVAELPGEGSTEHFGLAIRDYTHSTAPNRRFPDLVTQRLLKAAIAGRGVPYGDEELSVLARHCTEQEDDATKVERHVRKSAQALLLSSRIGERFDGIVTGASEKGTWARIFRPAAEGKVMHGFEDLDVGDRVRVELVGTDVERGFIDFARVRP